MNDWKPEIVLATEYQSSHVKKIWWTEVDGLFVIYKSGSRYLFPGIGIMDTLDLIAYAFKMRSWGKALHWFSTWHDVPEIVPHTDYQKYQ